MENTSEMKNLTEQILDSFKQRIKENEELTTEVRDMLTKFKKEHREMADKLKADATGLKEDLAKDEKERMDSYADLMKDVRGRISSIQKNVENIKASAINTVHGFSKERGIMAEELNKFFTQSREERTRNETDRKTEFDNMMGNITKDINNIHNKVSEIIEETNQMLNNFTKEHSDMSSELREKLGKDLTTRAEYTRSLIKDFQKMLAQISENNRQAAGKMREDLTEAEAERLKEYNNMMKDIQAALNRINKETGDIKNDTAEMLGDFLKSRVKSTAEWSDMIEVMANIRKGGIVDEAEPKAENMAEIKDAGEKTKNENEKEKPKSEVKEPAPKKEQPPKQDTVKTLEEQVLEYITNNPQGVKVLDMEAPLGETRMKIGFVAKKLLDDDKVVKKNNLYYPKPKK
jgi:uncharacterized phage infection (PIP) family protein YhgE